MTDLDQIISISPIQPTTGPQSRRTGAGMPLPSVAGIRDSYQGFMITNEALIALQDQIDTLKQLLGLSPSVNAINFPLLIITDLQFTNNSPSAGNIAWTMCTIYYNGQVYGISAGHTAASTDTLVWWVVGEASFRSGTSFTPNQTTFNIASNTSGTADIAYNKLGANSIQEVNVIGGFTSGYAPQNPSDVTIGGGATSTTLLSYTGAGGLVSIGITDTSGGSGSPGGNMTLAIVFDGGAAQTYTLRSSAFSPSGLWTTEFLNSAPGAVGSGSTSGDRGIIPFGTAFKTSCVITLNTPGGLQGGLACSVNWAKKLIV